MDAEQVKAATLMNEEGGVGNIYVPADMVEKRKRNGWTVIAGPEVSATVEVIAEPGGTAVGGGSGGETPSAGKRTRPKKGK